MSPGKSLFMLGKFHVWFKTKQNKNQLYKWDLPGNHQTGGILTVLWELSFEGLQLYCAPFWLFIFRATGEGNGNPLQCSCLENPRDGGAWWAAVYGVAQSRIRLKRLSSSSSSSGARAEGKMVIRQVKIHKAYSSYWNSAFFFCSWIDFLQIPAWFWWISIALIKADSVFVYFFISFMIKRIFRGSFCTSFADHLLSVFVSNFCIGTHLCLFIYILFVYYFILKWQN